MGIYIHVIDILLLHNTDILLNIDCGFKLTSDIYVFYSQSFDFILF